MHTVFGHFLSRLKNSERIRLCADALLNKYIFWVILAITAVPAAFRTEPLLYDLIPSVFTPFVHIVLCIFFSILTVKLMGKYVSGNGERLYMIVAAVLAAGVLNGNRLQFGDSLALYFLYFIFGLAVMKKTSIGIPLLLFVVILVRPVMTVPLIPWAVFFLKDTAVFSGKEEMQKKIRETVIACMVSTVIALCCHAALNGGIRCFVRLVTPEPEWILRLLSDTSKPGTALIVFSFFVWRYSSAEKPLKRTLMSSVVCTVIVFLLGQKYNAVLFSCLVMQGIVLTVIFRRSAWHCLTNAKIRRTILTGIVSVVILEQLLYTFDFYDRSLGAASFRMTPFYVCYQDFGFIQRGLFGTVFRLLFGAYIPAGTFLSAYFISYVILKLLFFGLIVRTMHYAKSEEERTVVMVLVFAFLVSPGFDKFYFEMFGYIMAWISVLLACRNGRSMFLIPVCCLLAMLTHQVFASIIFPVVFIVLVYRTMIDSRGHSVRNMTVLILTLLSVGGSFLYFSFFNAKNIDFTYEQVCDMINRISGGFFTPHEDMIKHVYLDSANEHAGIFISKLDSIQFVNLFCAFLVSLPALYLYIDSFVHSAKLSDSKIGKFGYLISALSVMAILPVFIIETDYGRWCSQYVSLLVLAPLILTVFQPPESKWYLHMSKKKLCIMAATVIVTALIQPNFEQLMYYYYLRFF